MTTGAARRRLRQVAFAWFGGFLLLSIALGYGIIHEDWRVTRLAFLCSLAWHPMAAMGAYYETKAAWNGEDYELREATVGGAIMLAVFGLSFLI